MQRVLITGAGAGIGRGLARRFAQRGDRVALCDNDPDAVAAMAAELPDAICVAADVRDEAAHMDFLARVEREWGGVDVVCANAGTGGPAGRVEEIDYTEWQECVAVNLHGAFLTCRWAARVLRAQGSGVILLTASTAGQFGYPGRSPYAAAKWAIVGLAKTLAMELGPAGVRVNAICPGAVEGDRMERVLANEAAAHGQSIETMRAAYVTGVSMKTWVTAQDVANSIHFLASEAGTKISGQVLSIDGHTETLAP